MLNKYKIDEKYSFSKSFLESIQNVLTTAPFVLLKEHYRCHPKIIEFCNQKFYNGQLIIMTEDKQEKDVLSVYKTLITPHG